MALQVARLVVVLALLCVAAAIATPKGRLPLALRGVARIFGVHDEEQQIPGWKKTLAFALVVLAVILALI